MFCMSPCELVSFITAAACTIANCCEEEEVELLASIFSQLGDTLATINIQQGIVCGQNDE